MLILSGISGVAPQAATLKSTADTLIYQLPADLADILRSFASHLGISKALPALFFPLPAPNTIYIEHVGGEAAFGEAAREIRFRFWIIKTRTQLPATKDQYTADYTLYRLILLLQANPTFDNLGGICGIRRINWISGTDAISQLSQHIPSGQFSAALLDVTYSLPESALNKIF